MLFNDIEGLLEYIAYHKAQDKGTIDGIAQQFTSCDSYVFYAVVAFERLDNPDTNDVLDIITFIVDNEFLSFNDVTTTFKKFGYSHNTR